MFDATAGGSSATSFISVEDADAYFADRLTPGSTQWLGFVLGDRQKALMQATREVDRLRFKGKRFTSTQALEFPRTGQREPFPAIPRAIRDATCEQAIYLLQNQANQGRSRAQALQAQGTKAFTVGDHSQEFAPGQARVTEVHLCPDAQALLRAWIAITGRVLNRRASIQPRGGIW